MPTPTQDANIVAEGKALLTSAWLPQPNVSGFLAQLLAEVQTLENAIFDFLFKIVLANHPLAGGPWQILDQIGAIVGVPRNGLSDASYLPLIYLKVRVDRSQGLDEDIIQISQLIAPAGQGDFYTNFPPAAWGLYAFGVTTAEAQALQIYLAQARSAGTRGTVYTVTWSSPTGVFIPASNTGTVSNATGFMDTVSGAFPNALINGVLV
jgi:hypothetical protein